MSSFEFFFSFYGLLLGLSVAAIATGMAIAIQNRKRLKLGWLTPLLALFVLLDVASFWDFAWNVFRDVPFTYGLLVAGLAIALTYFLAASLVFPYEPGDGASLDDHFWANKKLVLLLTTAANLLAVTLALPQLMKEGGLFLLVNYAITVSLYVVLVVPAAFARKPTLFAALIGLHVFIYLALGVLGAINPHTVETLSAPPAVMTPPPPPAPAS